MSFLFGIYLNDAEDDSSICSLAPQIFPGAISFLRLSTRRNDGPVGWLHRDRPLVAFCLVVGT
jgi:hypothetical protein